MFERLARDGRDHLDATRGHLHRYAEAGLRTLVLGQRPLPPEWYSAWRQRYEAARTSLGEEREALMDAAAEELERELALVGATAVEDKLQEGVRREGREVGRSRAERGGSLQGMQRAKQQWLDWGPAVCLLVQDCGRSITFADC